MGFCAGKSAPPYHFQIFVICVKNLYRLKQSVCGERFGKSRAFSKPGALSALSGPPERPSI